MPLADPTVYYYTSTSNISYYLNTSATSQERAEASCVVWGGHLALLAYNATEQAEVEAYFIQTGALIPRYHEFYWIGLTADSEDTGFLWLDRTLRAPGQAGAYSRWGTGQPTYQEDKTCAGANASLAFSRTWGWQAARCHMYAVYICTQSSE
jgi:hypothetical protein